MKPWQVLSSNVLIDRCPWLHVTEGYLLFQ